MKNFNKKIEIGKLIKKRDKMQRQIFQGQEWVKILEVEEKIERLKNE